MKKETVDDILKKLQKDGLVNEHINLDTGEKGKFSLNKKGLEEAKKLIQTPDGMLYFFKCMWNITINEFKKEKDVFKQVKMILDLEDFWNKEYENTPSFKLLLDTILEEKEKEDSQK